MPSVSIHSMVAGARIRSCICLRSLTSAAELSLSSCGFLFSAVSSEVFLLFPAAMHLYSLFLPLFSSLGMISAAQGVSGGLYCKQSILPHRSRILDPLFLPAWQVEHLMFGFQTQYRSGSPCSSICVCSVSGLSSSSSVMVCVFSVCIWALSLCVSSAVAGPSICIKSCRCCSWLRDVSRCFPGCSRRCVVASARTSWAMCSRFSLLPPVCQVLFPQSLLDEACTHVLTVFRRNVARNPLPSSSQALTVCSS